MSEENNLSSSSIYTTEDAFEKFQAGAMYQEDEYITLSDIVSPEPELPDLSNELNEIPYDNEVVLTSNDDDTPLNSNIEPIHQPNNDQHRSSKNEDLAQSYHNQEHEISGKINTNQKKGRRKAKSKQNPKNSKSNSAYCETENNSSMVNQAVQDNVLSTTADKNGIESNNDLQGEPKYPRRTRRERIPNTSKYPLISGSTFNNTPPSQGVKRRGRPKKSTLENLTISEPDSTNIDSSSVNEDLSYTENGAPLSSNQTPGRRGRRGRYKAPQAGSEQIDPNNSSNNINESTDTDLPLAELKKPTRKGRKKINKIIEKPSNTFEESQEGKEDVEALLPETGIFQFKDNKLASSKSVNLEHNTEESLFQPDDMDMDDDGDDICLSKLKKNINNITENFNDIETTAENMQGKTQTTDKRNAETSGVADFEYHIDKIGQTTTLDASSLDSNADESLLVEDKSKRPNRRKAKQNFKYDVDSDEDPFANVEISDDEPSPRKKGRYADDDEYIPGNKRYKNSVTTSSDSELNEDEDGEKNLRKLKRIKGKKGRKRKNDVETSVETPLAQGEDEPLSMKPPAEAWATSNEFENFIAQKIQNTSSLKIKKVSLKQKTDSVVTPLEIPVINQAQPKKFIEVGSQTTVTPTKSTAMQTSVPYDIPMKVNLNLTKEQSDKACAFLNSVVKTTAELGQLMKDKSEDFIKKKINTYNVTDTYKMDYCVRKSFLLFKLAKHNLMQMEEDLSKQYDEFLKSNNLSSCRDKLKNIAPKSKVDSDSDCEIVDIKEVPSTSQKKEKPKLNKTVFLNKELSIKIAKKPSADNKNVDVKGRHTIWINDSVMVKKVKPTQSFLAQDSRNKKPPDSITEKMVSDFFETYYRQKTVALCAPFISTEWSDVRREYACHYFVKCNDFDKSDSKNKEISRNMVDNASTSNGNCSVPTEVLETYKSNPKTLASLCIEVVHSCLYVRKVKETNEDFTCDLTDGKNRSRPLSLFRLCLQSLQSEYYCNMSNEPPTSNQISKEPILLTVPPLKSLCYKRITQLMPLCEELKDNGEDVDENTHVPNILSDASSYCEDRYLHDDEEPETQNKNLICPNSVYKDYTVKSLLSLCVNLIQTMYRGTETSCSDILENVHPITQEESIDLKVKSPKPLKAIVYKNIKQLMFDDKLTSCFVENPVCNTEETLHSHENSEDFTINCINTMTEEAFRRLEAVDEFQDEDDYDYEADIADFGEDNAGEETEWASQVQMQVLTTCVTPSNNLSDNECDETSISNACVTSISSHIENNFGNINTENDNQYQNTPHLSFNNINITSQIKLEPQDDIAENIIDSAIENIVDSAIVKTENVHGLDGMTIIPESIVTKNEIIEQEQNTEIERDQLPNLETTVSDVNTFEQFARKMMRPMDEDSDDEDDHIFSQSGLRVRREHEPDYDAENDMNDSLLIPRTYEPIHINNAKGVLMESSSDESRDGAKKQSKKKNERKKGKQKKGKEMTKNSNAKEIPIPTKELPAPIKDKASSNEVAVLTRRMREKIRQEEKKIESSDSESENVALSLRKDKSKKAKENESLKPESFDSESENVALCLRKDKNKAKENEKSKPTRNSKQGESSNNKDIDDVDNEIQCNDVDSTDQTMEKRPKNQGIPVEFTGFTAIDQNEISSYQKYMQFVYNAIVPAEDDNNSQEIIETNKELERSSSPLINPDQPVELLECEPSMPVFDDDHTSKIEKRPKKAGKKKEEKLEKDKPAIPKFTERDGWHLYSIDTTDAKLYQKCHIPLEKLPESFVDTYLQYHDITNRDNIDKEIDRLANLQSLNRATSIKEGKSKNRQKVKSATPSEHNSENASRAASPSYSDRCDELTPSEDEGANVDDELPPPVPVRATENIIAKDSLMDENESDSDGGTKKIKEEIIDNNQVELKHRPGPKSKTKMGKAKVDTLPPSESLMLTADKMMNKELSLLHAPIVMKEEAKEMTMKEPSPKDETKPKKRSLRNLTMRDRLKTEDDSSSEEEKQWVSTKEKLLKRIIGKKEDATADDAKRAKLVDDFIERRGEGPDSRRMATRTSRRSRKKMLERLKQQRVLSKELLGEPSVDLTPGGKRGAQSGLFKGRRNIRKVIDKKSLQKSTVLANMEEFERKRRLNSKLNQLRELLGCEEGVNVLVINDEVCLEYDFQEQRPVVTVHPFFTKVMKAHQYEGVKFMWDACFESLASIESGHGGGGCILAHCMGLGKTLQVLALLHTVLTHPRANMHRVLVCCPLSTVLNWVDEIHKWIGPVTDQIKVFELSKLKKTYERAYQLEDWYSGGGIFIIGYELFRSLTTLDPLIDEVRPTIINKIRTALLDPGPDIIICDEGHLLKNDCSVLAVAMSRVVTKRRIVLTGTPMQNNLREYYCMVNFVKPNLLGTYSEYSNRFENPIMNGQHRDSQKDDIKLMKARTHILHKVLEGCLQRQEASVLYPYLPKKHEYTVFIPLTKCQWDLYKHYVHHYTKESKQSVLRDFHILQKIWSHPLVLHNFSTREKKEVKTEKLEDDLALEDKEDIKPPATETWWLQYLADGAMLNSIDSSNKFVAVFRILDESIALGDKVLIFSTSLDCLDALEYFLRQINGWNLGQEYYRLDGSVPAEVRQKWVREYNAENNHKTKLFLISTRAGCLGLNMTAANRVIILDTSWNPAHDIQSIFRVYRFGQKKDCYIYRLVAMGTMEQKIYERSVTKQAVACRVVDEQQIDRHYNMAELTELYRFDEHGVGVAGGVAVGVGDVALLRVARDAAIHAVHEHDSLLRGSGEQGLPEHERAAAWMQFQQEHARKQMQNDMETDMADRALKKLQEQQLIQLQHEELQQLKEQQQAEQQQELDRQQSQLLGIKTEDGSIPELLVPKTEQPYTIGKGGWVRARGRGKNNIVCRIPIRVTSDKPGPSRAPPLPPPPPPPPPPLAPEHDENMVRQISELLIKHNYSETKKGTKLQDLVAKVKRMTQMGQVSFDDCDELTASIAKVLLQRQNKAPAAAPPPIMPALTDVEVEPRRRGRSRKETQIAKPSEVPEEPAKNTRPPEPVKDTEVGGRRRRRAALAAERQFDISDDGGSQDSVPPNTVIDLDDDDWQAHSDTDSAPETTPTPAPKETKPRATRESKKLPASKRSEKPECSSILLSDDEPSSLPPPVAKPPKPSEKNKGASEAVTPLHPSLLSNQNFIKIVAHTYLAGNPMLDEDAATLAAQYSAFKLLKETEASGKPIESGAIYDIAVKVLGVSVLKKLQLQPSDSKSKNSVESNAASSKMAQFLGQDAAPEPPPAPLKKKPGPKSRVKSIKDEPTEKTITTAPANSQQQKASGIVPVSLLRRVAGTSEVPRAPPDECILPDDDDDVRCVTEPPPAAKPVSFKVKLPPMKVQATKIQATLEAQEPVRVTSGGKPAAAAASSMSFATICLDSDEEEPVAPTPTPMPTARPTPTRRSRRGAAAGPAAAGPVPVALTGPNSQPLPLAGPPPAPPPPQPQPGSRKAFYPYSPAVRYPPEPVPVSLTGPDSRPVPISLTGPDNRPVPISLTGPGFQAMPISMGATGAQAASVTYSSAPAPASYVGSENVPMSFVGMTQGASSMPVTLTVPSSAAGGAAQAAGAVRTMRLSLVPGQASAALQEMASSVFLVPAAAAGDRVLTRVPASQIPLSMQLPPPPPLTPNPQSPNLSTMNKTYCKPGDILRISPSGKLEIIKSSDSATPTTSDVIHTIDDDEQSAPAPKAPTTRTMATRTSTPKVPTAVKSTPSATKPSPSATKPSPSATKPSPSVTKPSPSATKPSPSVSKPSPSVLKPSASKPSSSLLKPSPSASKPQPSTSTAPPTRARVQKEPPSQLPPKRGDKERRKRKVSFSSSSSDSSRSATPDPLSIFRDVVHIQAPTKHKAKTTTSKMHTSKHTATNEAKPTLTQTKSAPKPSSTQQISKGKHKDEPVSNKLKDILNAVKSKKYQTSSASKSTPEKSVNSKDVVAKIKDSIDLTEVKSTPVKGSQTNKLTPKGGKPTSIVKKNTPSTIVGTSKDIVLDGKSKSLMKKETVDLTQKSVQITNVKEIPSGSANKPKLPEKKRPAPPVETTAPKKKKTEPMTLKDFDIDDIDDIIELD